ncbi:hypothetical protein [Helicobacter anatolicus]|uniref:hypothetical protein n=1 Tax=Helicobacter anatolicus TaxID=2905874 RepID=UPI001E589E66|nr:hypothetical protein [Helicobacter anatolicus]
MVKKIQIIENIYKIEKQDNKNKDKNKANALHYKAKNKSISFKKIIEKQMKIK